MRWATTVTLYCNCDSFGDTDYGNATLIASGVATVAINGGANAALLAMQILAVTDAELAQKLDDKRRKDADAVLAKDASVMENL